MDGLVFNISLLAAGLAFLGVIALSFFGGRMEKAAKDDEARKKMEKAMKKIAFALFLVIGFSAVPIAVGIFIYLLPKAVSADIGIIEKNYTLIVLASWAFMAVGFAIALPQMRKDGFFGGD